MGWMVSPVRGSKGNVEFFVHAAAPGQWRAAVLGPAIDDRDGGGHAAVSAVTLSCTTSAECGAISLREAAQWLQRRVTRCACRSADAEAVELLDLAVPDEKLAEDVVARGEPRRRRHDAAHGRPGRGGRGAGPRRQRRPPGLSHRGRAERDDVCARALLRRRLRHRGPHDAVGHDPVEALVARRVELSRPERGGRREDAVGAHGADAREHRRRGVHVLRGGRAHRRDADRVDRVLAVGARPDRVAPHRACCSRRCRRTCCSTAR